MANLLDVSPVLLIKKSQERRWLASDVQVWEHPEELINSVDDYVLDGFIENLRLRFLSFEMSWILTLKRHRFRRACLCRGKKRKEGKAPPCHYQYKSHRGACGQTRIVP
jgi:hypothetical protein